MKAVLRGIMMMVQCLSARESLTSKGIDGYVDGMVVRLEPARRQGGRFILRGRAVMMVQCLNSRKTLTGKVEDRFMNGVCDGAS